MCFGFPGAVMMVRVFDANVTGSPAGRPALAALSMLVVAAEANTSAGAPWVSWVTRSEEPAKVNSTDAPGLSVLNCSPMSVKDFFSDAAAKTMIFPVAAAALDEPADGVARGDELLHEAAALGR